MIGEGSAVVPAAAAAAEGRAAREASPGCTSAILRGVCPWHVSSSTEIASGIALGGGPLLGWAVRIAARHLLLRHRPRDQRSRTPMAPNTVSPKAPPCRVESERGSHSRTSLPAAAAVISCLVTALMIPSQIVLSSENEASCGPSSEKAGPRGGVGVDGGAGRRTFGSFLTS